ncbi:hypothetical protein H0176_15385 [Methylorubrum populi]|uniref:hypothetical protein n=1 Tax=Methylorubrum rhodesianum TaxID=29427 RepID=UPI0006AFC031|nr:hypothetical protein [Methylorubrum rhodesianum]MBK3402339.1 hypothetical protein [Methylorubrum rhodesianum]MBY0141657.1 hypothetical protein [Methylorubrum populi]
MGEAVEPDPFSELRAFLREQIELAPSRKPSAFEAVKAVLPEIKELKAKRRTDAEIGEFLARMGVKLSVGTLRQYIQNATRELAGRKPVRRRRKARAKSLARTSRAPAEHRPGPQPRATAERDPVPTRGHAPASSALGHRMSNKDL